MTQINILPRHMFNAIRQIESEFPTCNFIYGEDQAEHCDVLFGDCDLDHMDFFHHLKWVQVASSGVDYYTKGNFPKNILLTNATGSYSFAIAEHLLAMHLSLYKNLHKYRDNQAEHKWKYLKNTRFIQGSTVLIIGLGSIGSEYAKRIKTLGAYIIGVKRTHIAKPDYVDELYTSDHVHTLIPRADMVVLATPSTPDTLGLLNADTISLMKDGAMIMNVGRGSLIDTNALCDAITSHKLAGAALDVVEPEPLPHDHPIWSLDDVLITPHMSGVYDLPETYLTTVETFRDNLHRFLQGVELKNLVDFATGYKKSNT